MEKTELVNEIGDSSRNNEKTKSMSEVNEKKENGGTEYVKHRLILYYDKQ